MSDVAYASPDRLILDAFDGLLPPEKEDVAAWAVKNRWMPGGAVRWSQDLAPYTVQPSRSLTSGEYTTVAIVGPGQVAKTVIAENWLGKSIQDDPADFLWYMQSDDGVESYVKGRINPLIDEHEAIRQKRGLRPVDDSLHFKRFRGMNVEFLSFGERTIINKSTVRIVADEIDNYQWLGNVKPVLDIRRQAAQALGRRTMLLAMSHPDMALGLDPAKHWSSGIMAIYADSTRRCWYWRCPHCGAVSSPAPIADRVMTLEYPSDPDVPLDVVAAEAHLLCPVNGCVVADHEREAMNLDAFNSPWGGWIGLGQEIDEGGTVRGDLQPTPTDGVWIVGAMSPFVMGGIGGLARERVKAERETEISGEDQGLRHVIVKQWGIPYTPRRGIGSIEASELVDRADGSLRLKTVPNGVRFLVAVVDCQMAHFEYLVRGFGVRGESWIIDTGRIPADPATSADDWDKLLELAGGAYPLADGSGRMMAVRALGYDSGGQPGVTRQAYDAWTRWRRDRRIRNYGRMGGRDVFSIIPLKGASTPNAPRLQVTYPDTARRANVMAAAGTVPVAAFNPNQFKDDLVGQLRVAEAGDWCVHFPAALKSKTEPHVWFEQLVAERQLPNGRWEKINPSARNEALDLMVMSHVVAHLNGLSRIDWDRAPGWAADWATNSAITALPADVAAAPAAEELSVTVAPPASAPFSAAPAAITPAGRPSLSSRLPR